MLLVEPDSIDNIEYRIYEYAYFASRPKRILSRGFELLDDSQALAVNKFGYSWDEVEAIEIKAYKDAEAGHFDPPVIS